MAVPHAYLAGVKTAYILDFAVLDYNLNVCTVLCCTVLPVYIYCRSVSTPVTLLMVARPLRKSTTMTQQSLRRSVCTLRRHSHPWCVAVLCVCVGGGGLRG